MLDASHLQKPWFRMSNQSNISAFLTQIELRRDSWVQYVRLAHGNLEHQPLLFFEARSDCCGGFIETGIIIEPHPARPILDVFDAHKPGPNQLGVRREHAKVTE